MQKIQHVSDVSEQFLSRRALAKRWGCCVETVKRREAAGLLNPLRFSRRQVRYELSQIVKLEIAARKTNCELSVL